MSDSANPFSKESQLYPGTKVLCACGCGIEGPLKRKAMKDGVVHVHRCTCRRCLGSRNRTQGLAKQRVARKRLGVPPPKFAGANANEEAWEDCLRHEVKAGLQIRPMVTAFTRIEAEAEGKRPIGDNRGLAITVMPDGWGSEGIVSMRLSVYQTQVRPYLPGRKNEEGA